MGHTGGRDSTPVRGVLYEPVALLGESAEPRLSRIRIGVVMLGAFLGFLLDCDRYNRQPSFYQKNDDDDKSHETEVPLDSNQRPNTLCIGRTSSI